MTFTIDKLIAQGIARDFIFFRRYKGEKIDYIWLFWELSKVQVF